VHGNLAFFTAVPRTTHVSSFACALDGFNNTFLSWRGKGQVLGNHPSRQVPSHNLILVCGVVGPRKLGINNLSFICGAAEELPLSVVIAQTQGSLFETDPIPKQRES